MSKDIRAYLALVVVCLVWGTTFGSVHLASDSFPPAMIVCLRFTIAGLLLIGFSLLRGDAFPTGATLKRHLMVGFLLFFAGNSFVAWAVRYVPTGLGATLIATNPFWMIWLSSLLPPREKIHPTAFLGLIVGFIGILILLSPKLTSHYPVSPLFWATLVGILAMTFFWSLGSIYARKHPAPEAVMMGIGVQNLFAGILLMPVTWLTWQPTEFHPQWQGLLALAHLILLGTIVAVPSYMYVLKRLPVSVSSMFSYVTPVVSIAFGWWVFGEPVTPITILGTGIILAGVALVQWVNQQQQAAHAAQGIREQLRSKTKPIWHVLQRGISAVSL